MKTQIRTDQEVEYVLAYDPDFAGLTADDAREILAYEQARGVTADDLDDPDSWAQCDEFPQSPVVAAFYQRRLEAYAREIEIYEAAADLWESLEFEPSDAEREASRELLIAKRDGRAEAEASLTSKGWSRETAEAVVDSMIEEAYDNAYGWSLS